MAIETYAIILEEGAQYIIDRGVYTYEHPIGAQVLRDITDIPNFIRDLDQFDPEDELLYYESAGGGYINPSTVETIVNLDTVIDEELDKLEEAIEDLDEATQYN